LDNSGYHKTIRVNVDVVVAVAVQLLISKAKASQAQDALEQLLGSGSAANPNNNPSQQCALLTEAVISK
jgi:hypothetical protein